MLSKARYISSYKTDIIKLQNEQHLNKVKIYWKIMVLSIRDCTIIKIAQATHHQGDVRYGTSRGIQCSCMSLMSITWTSPGLWDKFDLDSILGKGDHLFKFIGKFRYLGIEDLPQEFLVENVSVNVKFLENKTGEVTAGAYLTSISEIGNGVRQIGAGALVIVNNYILGLIWGNHSIYIFNSHSKDENGNLSSSGTAVLLKFDMLYSLENYVRSVYDNIFPPILYFQLQLKKVHCTATAKNAIKSILKKERLSAKWEKNLLAKKRKYDNPVKKMQAFKKRYHDKSKSIKKVSEREISDESNIRNKFSESKVAGKS